MTEPVIDEPATAQPGQIPAWLQPLADVVRSVRTHDLTRVRGVPDGVTPRESAVLVALSHGAQGPAVLLLERAATLREHAGQVAFPGGARDPGETLVQTALREAEEEVGLRPDSVQIVASLPGLYIPPSGFLVTPVLGWWRAEHEVGVVDVGEVARVVNVPVAELADPANRGSVVAPSGWRGPVFTAGGLFVWGFTAGVLDALLRFAGWSKPWDSSREFPLPDVLSVHRD